MRREFIKELRGDSQKDTFDLYNHIDLKELKEAYLAYIPQLGISHLYQRVMNQEIQTYPRHPNA